MYVFIMKIKEDGVESFIARTVKHPDKYIKTLRETGTESEFIVLFDYPDWATYKISRFFRRLGQTELNYYSKQSIRQLKIWFDKAAGLNVPVLDFILNDEKLKRKLNRGEY
jgi:hypothetical protein